MASFLVRPAGSGGKELLPGILVAAASKNRQVALTAGVVLGYFLSSALLLAPIFINLKLRYLANERRFIFVKPTRMEKRPGARTAYGHITAMFGCIVWALFAIPSFRKNVGTVIINGAGSILQLAYVGRFLYHAGYLFYFLMAALSVSALLTALVVVMVIVMGVWNATFIGVIASVVTGLASIFVIVDTVAVLKTRRASINLYELVELLLSISTAATWTYCAFLVTPVDLYSGIPCAIGLAFLSVQLIVSLMYRTDDEDFSIELHVACSSPQCRQSFCCFNFGRLPTFFKTFCLLPFDNLGRRRCVLVFVPCTCFVLAA